MKSGRNPENVYVFYLDFDRIEIDNGNFATRLVWGTRAESTD
jgi:hypothetical protein